MGSKNEIFEIFVLKKTQKSIPSLAWLIAPAGRSDMSWVLIYNTSANWYIVSFLNHHKYLHDLVRSGSDQQDSFWVPESIMFWSLYMCIRPGSNIFDDPTTGSDPSHIACVLHFLKYSRINLLNMRSLIHLII